MPTICRVGPDQLFTEWGGARAASLSLFRALGGSGFWGNQGSMSDICCKKQQKQPDAYAASDSVVAMKTKSPDRSGNCCAEILRAGVAAEVRGAGASFRQDFVDGALDGRCRRALAELVEHHRTRPDLAGRVGESAARNVRRRAMHRLEHRRAIALGVDVAGPRAAD